MRYLFFGVCFGDGVEIPVVAEGAPPHLQSTETCRFQNHDLKPPPGERTAIAGPLIVTLKRKLRRLPFNSPSCYSGGKLSASGTTCRSCSSSGLRRPTSLEGEVANPVPALPICSASGTPCLSSNYGRSSASGSRRSLAFGPLFFSPFGVFFAPTPFGEGKIMRTYFSISFC